MFPELIHGIPTYGPLILLGILCGIVIFRRLASHMPMDHEWATDVIILSMIFGFLGARLLQVVVMHEVYLSGSPLRILKLWDGGFAYIGGIIGGSATLFFLRRRINLPLVADLMVIPLAFTHMVGRLGCLSAGCCHGKVTSSLLGVQFRGESAARAFCATGSGSNCLSGVHFHPTQLYEALGLLAIAIILILYNKKKRFHGHLTALYLLLYGCVRFVVEIYRGDPTRGFIVRLKTPGLAHFLGLEGRGPLFISTSQLLSAVLVGCGLGIVWYNLKKTDKQGV